MAKNQFKEARFHDEEAARQWFEASRWPDGPVCPHCGSLKHYETKKTGRYRCGEKECRKDFTVQTKSVMERSHAPLTQWAMAFYMYAASKKGFTAMQLQRALGCQYNTAWFLHHRVMEAMRRGGLEPPLGGSGKVVEADETYFGKVAEASRRSKTTRGTPFTRGGTSGPSNKRAIVALIERGGNVRSFHVAVADQVTVHNIVSENIVKESRLHTDESQLYRTVGPQFTAHETVKHSAKEYVRGDVHTNTIEGYFGIFKRGMRGNYQHCAEKNLHRYLAEFDFRYNSRDITDSERAALAVKGGENKRLTYRQPH
jgi:transposase-like protein